MAKKKKDLSKPLEKLEWEVGLLYDGRRLDKFVHHKSHWRSRTTVQQIIKDGGVTVNGEPGKANMRLKKGDLVVVKLNLPKVDLSEIKLDIIYEDDLIIALNKQPGMLVHPAGKRLFGTLINALHARYKSEPDVTPMLCHRLDEFTSGALLIAKDANSKRYIQREFEAGRIDKTYLAIVEGNIAEDEGRIDVSVGAFKGKAPDYRTRMQADVPWGQEALTEYRIEERFGDFTLVRCILHTGRTHQIRVHLNHIGHPVLCDSVYTGREKLTMADLGLEGDEPVLERQALHSATLKFMHPLREESLTIEADLAEDISRTVKLLQGRSAHETKRTE
jgi:23S rRNA pseudouridine1911/1915/1917 synthase